MKNMKNIIELYQALSSDHKRLANKLVRALHAGEIPDKNKRNIARCINRGKKEKTEGEHGNNVKYANAHTVFFKERHHKEKAKGKTFTQIGVDIGKEWKRLPNNEKKRYREIAVKTRARSMKK